ncbi:WD40/YVTN/BNR-like repeat-containing protein [Amycolatopsis taiwanensis]|uniref:Uncharacterized protein n=1 Tax=Amycolatopsis taiwanensis TaxID=342230 RepID=A0A9W6R5X7_9PSEU|nr:dispase autolysis-inducing protein [Amycolatopsis taiwanensis]GLY69298.1 hypothetical protein Atai01_59170 [Amycolatopsis taiwanensis]
MTGDGSVTFTRNQGKVLTPTSQRLQPVTYTTGMAVLDQPNTLLAMENNTLLSSVDAGCTWKARGEIKGRHVALVPAGGDRAYAWDLDGGVSLATPAGVTPLTSPGVDLAGFAVDRRDSDHVRVADDLGRLYDSTDGGHTWTPIGVPGPPQGELTLVYTAAFDPSNVDHVVLGTMGTGAYATFDGGRTWTKSAGLGPGNNVNVFSGVISPAASDVVYVNGLNEAESNAGAPSQGRHIYKSTDGGRNFTPVVDQDSKVTLPNGPVMAADPRDPGAVYFVFGTYYQGYGTDIYKYNSNSRNVSVAHNPYDRVTSIAFHPQVPGLMYLGLAEER